MKRVLIIGVNSFIGKSFMRNSSMFNVLEYDIQNGAVEEIDFSGVDVVFHVAAIVHQYKSISDEMYCFVNRDLAFNVAKAAKAAGVKQFVFMSTVKVYGENTEIDKPWTEQSECHPVDAYGKSKLAAEHLLNTLQDDHFIISIIRAPLVYGSGAKANVKRVRYLVEKCPIIPLGGIKNKRAMVYVRNLVALIQCVIEKSQGGLFLANDGSTLSTTDFVKYLVAFSGRKCRLVCFSGALRFVVRFFFSKTYRRLFASLTIDSSSTFNKLDFTPPFSVEEGLKDVMK